MSTDENTLEDGYSKRAQGYDALGSLMGAYPETAILRRFGALAAQDLLLRQAELVELEEDLRSYQREDKDSGHEDREQYTLSWDKLNRSKDEDASEGNDPTQLETILTIREKLKDYQDALIRHRQTLDLGRPVTRQVKALNNWMERPSMGNVFLQGPDRDIWKNPDMDDLITLAPPATEIKFTNKYTVALVQFYNAAIGRHIHKAGTAKHSRNTIRYTDEGIFRVLKTSAVIIASLLPVAGIAVLYAIETMSGRIGAIAGFTALFSFSLSFITSASVHHIFSATAAFVAVLVVFVGTTDMDRRVADSAIPN